MSELTFEEIAELLPVPTKQPARSKTDRHKPNPVCSDCGGHRDNGYCTSLDCPSNYAPQMHDCESCGYCEKPGRCAASTTCSVCGSRPTQLCIDGRGGLTGFHRERWVNW